jgi:NAD(P)-dependent dehydrogenase (short-subunit alcohol dehydrogenase family)
MAWHHDHDAGLGRVVRAASHPLDGDPLIVDRGEARYCASKLLNLMHVRHLAQEMPSVGVVAYNPSVVPGTEIGRDRNWMQQLGWKYIMPLLTPVLPGTRSLKQYSGDLLWLLTEADAQSMSGNYVDGREIRPGSLESMDRVKIARTVEVARWLIDDRLRKNRVSRTSCFDVMDARRSGG